MPVIMPDTSGAEGPVLIDPGTYKARIRAAEPQRSKEKGTPMLKLTLAVDYNGKERTRFSYVITSGAASWQFDSLLRAIGEVDLADRIKQPGSQVEFDTDTLIDREIQVQVDHELYNGQTQDRVKGFLKA